MRSPPRLLWISDRRRAGSGLPELAGRLASEGVDGIQVREPDLGDAELFALVRSVVEAVRGFEVSVLVNDRVDLALAAGAQGVQLKSDGLSVGQARAIAAGLLGEEARDFLVGRSCHRGEEVAAAAEAGASFVTLSPLHDGAGKRGLGPEGFRRELEEARRLLSGRRLPPWLALGGVGVDDLPWLRLLAGPGERWGVAAIRALQGDGRGPRGDRFARALVDALRSSS